MLDFESFCLKVKENIREYLEPEFKEFKVIVRKVQKGSAEFKIFCLMGEDRNVKTPVVPLDAFYKEKYCEYLNGNLEQSLKMLAVNYERMYRKSASNKAEAATSDDIQIDVKKVFYTAINYEANKEQLEGVLFDKEKELAVVYRLLIEDNDETFTSIPITDNIVDAFDRAGVSAWSIKEAARSNTEELFPYRLIRINDDSYFLTSESYSFGATSILYRRASALKELVSRYNKDILVVPVSINTVYICLTDEISEREYNACNDELRAMAEQIGEPALNDRIMIYDKSSYELLYGKDTIKMSEKRNKTKAL